jgi:hypothetical protein
MVDLAQGCSGCLHFGLAYLRGVAGAPLGFLSGSVNAATRLTDEALV